jgi:hypothetical protein
MEYVDSACGVNKATHIMYALAGANGMRFLLGASLFRKEKR